MIDTAKNGYLGSNSQAKNIMLEYMKDKGINNLYALILSHFDADHAGGTVDILENINVRKLYITDVYENTSISDDIQNLVKSKNIPEEIITDKKEIYNKNNLVVTLLKPKGELVKTENQKSLIAHFSYKGKNFLFMGDGDVNSYDSLEEKFKQNIAVIKSGHHGAKNTVNDEMARNSDLFILSTGRNVYNHPHPQTIKTIEQNSKHYLRTDYSNAVKITADSKIHVQKYSPVYKKFI